MKIGFLGTGLMGQPMVQRLLAANVPVIAYNRTAAKLQPLRQAGAEIAANLTDLVQVTDCIIVMLTDASAIYATLLSEEVRLLLRGRTIIQMGTIAPDESQAIHQAVVAAGGDYLEAPVLGSISEVKNGTLHVMVGSSEAQFTQWSPLLKHFSAEPLFVGKVGQAATLKLALNQLIVALMAAFSLSLGLIQRQQVDVEKFMQILRGSALYAPTFDKKLPRLLIRDYANPNFPTKHMLKDVNLVMSLAQNMGLATDVLQGLQAIVQKATAEGLGEGDYSAIFSIINPS